jgi:hypothetical protein
MIGLPDVAEHQKPDASNAGLERGYLNMSTVSLTPKGVRPMFRVDRKPKDLLFFTEGEKYGRKNKHGQALLKPTSCFPKKTVSPYSLRRAA